MRISSGLKKKIQQENHCRETLITPKGISFSAREDNSYRKSLCYRTPLAKVSKFLSPTHVYSELSNTMRLHKQHRH